VALSNASILKNFSDADSLINEPDMAGFLNKSLALRITRLPRARGNITGFSWAKKIPHGVNHAGFNLA
jgi:hypothetical protein